MGSILSKLQSIPEDKQKEIMTFLAHSDPSNSGFIPYESFRYIQIQNIVSISLQINKINGVALKSM